MKKKIFIDTDVFLDTLLNREPHCIYSNKIIDLCEKNETLGYTSTLVLANLYYIIKKIASHKKAISALNKIKSFIAILPVTEKEISESINAEFNDFEDGIQYFVANNNEISCIVTRNVKDFKKSSISIQTPNEFLQCIKTKKQQ